jgi:Ca2+/H+ antiporter, TMEM165/GDT1 family
VPTFFLAWLAVAACSLGGRDQMLVARLAGQGRSGAALLAVAIPAAALTAGALALAGSAVSALLPPAAKHMLVAFALVAAAVELALPVRERAPREPTRSLFALLVVLMARQLGDGARFLVFAFAAAGGSAMLAALGGALGGASALAVAVSVKDDLARWPLTAIRRALAVLVGTAAIYIGLSARGLL